MQQLTKAAEKLAKQIDVHNSVKPFLPTSAPNKTIKTIDELNKEYQLEQKEKLADDITKEELRNSFKIYTKSKLFIKDME